jgi:p-hydroxybenzoate 3-monooxygenase
VRTQVGIIGAGPAGLFLAHLLQREGIDTVVIEDRSRDYVEHRIRAGLLENWFTDLLIETDAGDRLQREGLVHEGIALSVRGVHHRIDFKRLVDRHVTIYGQQEVVKDLIALRLASGAPLHFEVSDVSVHEIDSTRPKIRFQKGGALHELDCDFIAGCDGFHGICRPSIPAGVLTTFERLYPFGWLGILSASPPPSHELIYAHTDRGFALYTMRSPTLSRLYLQCAANDDVANWPDARIWEELHRRIGGNAKLEEGEVLQRGITPMRSFVVEPMQYGRLFLAGDAAHIVPPTGAKGMNLAAADVLVLTRALADFYHSGNEEGLARYSETCLRRIWKAQRFSWWMTSLLHRYEADSPFDQRRQMAELDYLVSSEAASKSLAENYVGLPLQ